MSAQIPTLSVRQPWAWAIIHAGKDVENRSARSITLGRMGPGMIHIHAAKGMSRDEYESAAAFMSGIGVACPQPADLIRSAIIGAVTVVGIVRLHPSPWFFGPCALVLASPIALCPIPGPGKLGYFEHLVTGTVAEPLPWMVSRNGAKAKSAPEPDPLPLFGDVA